MKEYPELTETKPKRPGLSLLSKGLANADEFLSQNKLGALLSSGLGVPDASKLLEKLAYGDRLTVGTGQARKPAESVVEGGMALAPVLGSGLTGLGKLTKKIPLQRDSAPNALVWHGSPHKFDKFDSSKIGTGEGAQAYGHGLYLAESPKVAESYKRALSPGNGLSDDDTLVRALGDDVDLLPTAIELERRAKYANMPGGAERLLMLAEKLRSGYDPRGSLYKVDLPDDQIAKMLDWDKPLSAQPSILNAIDRKYDPEVFIQQMGASLDSSGGDLLRGLGATRDAGKSASVSEMLNRDFQIPGVRYLDGMARREGQGTSNYVVFPGNESFLQILERNGVPLNSGLARGR